MAYAKIRPRRGTLYEWTAVNPVIAEGEFVIEVPESGVGTGFCKFKIGDGYTDYDNLPYAFDAEAASAIYGGSVDDYNEIYLRSGTEDEWTESDPILGKGEIVAVFDNDGNFIGLKIGDGVTKFSELRYVGEKEEEFDYDFGEYIDTVDDTEDTETTDDGSNSISLTSLEVDEEESTSDDEVVDTIETVTLDEEETEVATAIETVESDDTEDIVKVVETVDDEDEEETVEESVVSEEESNVKSDS